MRKDGHGLQTHVCIPDLCFIIIVDDDDNDVVVAFVVFSVWWWRCTHTHTHRHRHTHREIERWDVMVAIVEPFQFMLDSSSEPSILEFQPSKQTNVRHRIQSKQSTNWSWHEMYLAVPVNTFDVVPSSL